MSLKINYVDNGDSPYEITYKNRENIIALSSVIDTLPTGIEFAELKTLVGSYSQDVANDLDETKSVIENLSIVASNLQSALARIKTNEEQITLNKTKSESNKNEIDLINKDGIGEYLGTYRTRNNDDSSTLPVTPQAKSRAIAEYASGDDYKYQEWRFNNGVWSKWGSELDSHIHSQSTGITLTDVANQQDPKIAKKLDITKGFSSDDYEEKEITITPAIYGWKTINDLWTNPDKFNKYIDKEIRITFATQVNYALQNVTINSGGNISSTTSTHNSLVFGLSDGDSSSFFSSRIDSGSPDVAFTYSQNKFIAQEKILKVQTWDIITPAVKATVLVKK